MCSKEKDSYEGHPWVRGWRDATGWGGEGVHTPFTALLEGLQ